jgi:isoquinoline 1-oxidoreductase alpha subunit
MTPILLNVNGEPVTVDVIPDTPLLWVLRDTLGLTGTKYSCGIGECGACTVHLDGQAFRSCVVPAAQAADRVITTIEGLSPFAGSLDLRKCAPMRLLPAWSDHDRRRLAGE